MIIYGYTVFFTGIGSITIGSTIMSFIYVLTILDTTGIILGISKELLVGLVGLVWLSVGLIGFTGILLLLPGFTGILLVVVPGLTGLTGLTGFTGILLVVPGLIGLTGLTGFTGILLVVPGLTGLTGILLSTGLTGILLSGELGIGLGGFIILKISFIYCNVL